LQCNGAGGVPPVTLVEIRLNGDSGKDFYDVSLVDGFNVPAQVRKFLGQTRIAKRFCFTCVYSVFVNMEFTSKRKVGIS
jgi:hypothetical protein